MNAAEGLASEVEATLRKACKYTDAAGGKLSAPVSGAKRKHQSASSYKQKCPGCGSFDHVYQECIYRLSLLSPQWVSDITRSVGDGTSRSTTWILSCTRTIAERVCSESGFAGRSLLRCRVNPLVESGRYLGVGSPLRTVAAIPRPGQTCSRISRLTNAIAALVSRTRSPAERSSMIGVARQRAPTITGMTMPRIVIATRIGSGIDTAELSATQGVVAETLRRIVAATPGKK